MIWVFFFMKNNEAEEGGEKYVQSKEHSFHLAKQV
jgi:hypothetical protein